MTQLNQIYKCGICGNIVEMVHASDGQLVCCGKPMDLQIEKSEDEGVEKHKPVVSGKNVAVGSVPHPMEEKHYIEWVESIYNDGVERKNLKAGDKPEANFEGEVSEARAYCNVHGLWKN